MDLRNKKGSANMWWIIIGAVVALVVMIVLMVMFTGKSRTLEGGLSDCSGKGGVCVTSSEECPVNSLKSGTFSCSESADQGKCCIGAPKRCNPNATDCGDTSEFECRTSKVSGETKNYCFEI